MKQGLIETSGANHPRAALTVQKPFGRNIKAQTERTTMKTGLNELSGTVIGLQLPSDAASQSYMMASLSANDYDRNISCLAAQLGLTPADRRKLHAPARRWIAVSYFSELRFEGEERSAGD